MVLFRWNDNSLNATNGWPKSIFGQSNIDKEKFKKIKQTYSAHRFPVYCCLRQDH